MVASPYANMNTLFPPISPIHFADAMEARWTSVLKNKSSPALRHAWKQIAAVYGSHIIRHSDPVQHTKWVVLDPPTGSGKTQGTMLYCSMMANLPADQHPGVLLVTRRIEDADSIAAEINKLSNKTHYAISDHSEKAQPVARETLADFPVLVITHSAYNAAMSRHHDEHAFNQTWPYFYEWQGVGRRLVVIDEAPNLVEHFHIGLDELRQTLGALPQTFREKHPIGCKVLGELVGATELVASEDTCSERILPRLSPTDFGREDMSSLVNGLRAVRFDQQSGSDDTAENQRLYAIHRGRLKAVQNVITGDMYYARVDGKLTLSFSRPMVPEGVKGAVVLDATASTNVIYELFDRATILPMAKSVRSYKNVTIHVNRGQNLGKDYLAKHLDRVLIPVIDDLNTRLKDREVFFATHKGIKQKVLAAKTSFRHAVGTWGAIDGSNTWKDYDTAVVIGLPYKPDSWTANTYQGLQGMQDTNWFQAKSRPFGDHADIRSALKTGQIITDLVQAINRIRCRQVNDSEGNCPNAEVYLLLPEGAVGDKILNGITNSMEGFLVKPWIVEGFEPKTTGRGRPSGTGTAFLPLVQALTNMHPGMVFISDLAVLTNTTSSTLKRFIATFTKETNTAATILKALGGSYVVEGKGCNAKSYFLKT